MSDREYDERAERAPSAESLEDAFAGVEIQRSDTVTITGEDDILRARQTIRKVAEEMDYRLTDVTRVVTAVSELSRNIHLYADSGIMEWAEITDGRRTGIELVFTDDGPGIEDVDAALQGNFSTSNGMGRGLTGTRKLVDEFDIETGTDGTTIRIRKWKS